MRKTSLNLDEEFHRKVRVYCAQNDCQIKDLFIEAVTEKMERAEND